MVEFFVLFFIRDDKAKKFQTNNFAVFFTFIFIFVT